MDDMDTIMKGVQKVLKKDGVLVFEVHYLINLLKKLQYDFFYQEHFSYYTITALRKFLKKYNLEIFDIKKIPIHSGSVRVFARFSPASAGKVSLRAKKLIYEEKQQLSNDSIAKFSVRVAKQKKQLKNLLTKLKKKNKRLVGYGAAGRGNTLLNVCQIDYSLLDYIVDESPERYGRYTPGTHIPIVPPEIFRSDRPDFVLLLAWNYKKAIYEKEAQFLKDGGKFILPLPTVKIDPR